MYYLEIVEGCHRQAAVDIFHNTGEQPCTADQLFMHLIVRQDVTNIKQAEAFKLDRVHTTL